MTANDFEPLQFYLVVFFDRDGTKLGAYFYVNKVIVRGLNFRVLNEYGGPVVVNGSL